jgi:CheY-like chemotaxis protein
MSEATDRTVTGPRVVLVDVRDERRQMMRRVVEGDDTKAVLVGDAASAEAALAVVDEQEADVVILDVNMPVPVGLATIAALRGRYPQLGIVACSFDLDPATVAGSLAAGANSVLAKPVTLSDVQAALAALAVSADRNEPADAAHAGPG